MKPIMIKSSDVLCSDDLALSHLLLKLANGHATGGQLMKSFKFSDGKVLPSFACWNLHPTLVEPPAFGWLMVQVGSSRY